MNRMAIRQLVLAFSVFLGGTASSCYGTMIRNGGFEFPDAPASGFLRISAATAPFDFAWLIESGDVDLVDKGLFGSQIGMSDGDQSLDLDGQTPGTISQRISLQTGMPYRLEFAIANNPFSGATVPAVARVQLIDSQTEQFLINQVVTHATSSVEQGNWTQLQLPFTAFSDEAKLIFRSMNRPPTSGGILLDGIAIRPVPEPGTLIGLLLGGLLLWGCCWHRAGA